MYSRNCIRLSLCFQYTQASHIHHPQSSGPSQLPTTSQTPKEYPIANMAPNKKVLVYHLRPNGSPAVNKALAVVTEQELADIVAKRKCPFYHLES